MITDRDVRVLSVCVRALEASSSARMVEAHAEYLYDRYVRNPAPRRKPTRRTPTDSDKEGGA